MFPSSLIKQQQGAGLPLAIFIITVLALLVIGMAQLQDSSAQSVSLQIQSQRAFFAAESGAQVGVAEVLGGGACGAVSSPVVFSTNGLNTCQANLTCNVASADVNGDGSPETIFTVGSAGRCGTGSDLAVREVEVRVR